ncbi:MAG: hypothetical protein ABR568_20135 [Pyrinomonadaceae bacterium]
MRSLLRPVIEALIAGPTGAAGSDSDRTQPSASFKKHAIDEHSCNHSQRTEG